MERYRLADIIAEIECRYDYSRRLLRDYRHEGEQEPDLKINVTKEDVIKEREKAITKQPEEYLESIALYRKFCEKVLDFKIMLFHASAISFDNKAYLFTGPSGMGKSTHAGLWKERFGDSVKVINDDKPLLRILEDGIYAYGTPWDGKHRISTNMRARVAAICVLQQSQTNEIVPMKSRDAYQVILNQTYRPGGRKQMEQILGMADTLIKQIPVYYMRCNLSTEAARIAYEGMNGKRG
ncbi:hypothetical protein HNQ56_002883 [Anaerotaenia torta]|uniref:hypothetical protein n=1 Tax=Anaerotaenia torta TaxID=433293 RepID=UPI003D1B7448